MAIAFFIPFFPRVVPVIIALLFVISLFGMIKFKLMPKLNEVAILMSVYYLLYLLGMSYTENIERGLFELEVKLSLIAFPMIFLSVQALTQKAFESVLKAFIYGTFTQAIVSILRSFWNYSETGDQNSFFVSEFSQLLHPNYFSLYLVFSIILLCYLEWPIIQARFSIRHVLSVIAILFASVCVILTGSKSGLIMLIGTSAFIIVYLVRDMKQKWLPVLGALLLTSALGAIIEQSPILKLRIQNALNVAGEMNIHPDMKESTAARALVYKSSWNLVISQPWYGQGTGDFQDAMDEQYRKSGFIFPLKRHLNTHNAFLQAWVTLGIPGLVMLIGIFIVMLNQAWKIGQRTYFGFLALFLLISLTESSMNVQAGVVFFSFFALIFSSKILQEAE